MAADRSFLAIASCLLSAGILFECLRPFSAPPNSAHWFSGVPILSIGWDGVLLSTKPLIATSKPNADAFTIELWLQPDTIRHKGTVLAIYSDQTPRQNFSIRQEREGLELRNPAGDTSFTPDVFAPGQDVFISVTTDHFGTEVYIDGILRGIDRSFHITGPMLSGNLVVGTAPVEGNRWVGIFRSLAIYTRAISEEQIRDHVSRFAKEHLDAGTSGETLALFPVDEGTGRILHNKVAGGADLFMPPQLVIPDKGVLLPPSLDDPVDIIANILGYIPLGFTLCGYLATRTGDARAKRVVILTTILCGSCSLVIEFLQAFLPTRDSSLTDVITNTLGAAIGAIVYRQSFLWLRFEEQKDDGHFENVA